MRAKSGQSRLFRGRSASTSSSGGNIRRPRPRSTKAIASFPFGPPRVLQILAREVDVDESISGPGGFRARPKSSAAFELLRSMPALHVGPRFRPEAGRGRAFRIPTRGSSTDGGEVFGFASAWPVTLHEASAISPNPLWAASKGGKFPITWWPGLFSRTYGLADAHRTELAPTITGEASFQRS